MFDKTWFIASHKVLLSETPHLEVMSGIIH
jgi:hypothetical protein